jgi:DHA1 family multidrug resistance protein-like MFS transporter
MTLVVFIAFFGFNFVMPILPLYVRALGVADVSQAALLSGLMLAVSPLMAAFCSPLWGVVADRFGRKRMVQRSLLVFAVACTLMGLVANVAQLFALRAAIGVFGGFTSMTMAYIVTVAPAARASGALGLLQSAQVAGLIVGPLCAGFVADHFGLRASFYCGAAVILAGFAAVSLLTQDDRVLASKAPSPTARKLAGGPGMFGALRAAATLPGFLPVMVVLFLAQFVDRSFGPILPLYVAALGTPADQVASYSGLVVSLGAVGTAVSATALGQLAGRLPGRRLLLATLVAGTALCFPMALVATPGQLLLVRTLLGLFAGGTLTLAYSLANDAVPAASKGAAFGVLSSISLLGSASSPLITGALTRLDIRTVFALDSVLYAIALIWAARAGARSKRSSR